MYNTTTNEFTYSNAIAIAGTLATSGNITVGGNLVANSNVASTSNVTGALVVIGGVGVTGSIYSNSLYTNGLFWAGNGQVISTGGGTSGVSGSTNTSIYSSVSKVTTTTTLIDSFVASGDIFVKWIITSIDNVNKNYAACTIDSVNDYFNVYYTEYADIRSNSLSSVASFTSNITAGNINLWATGISSNVTVSAERIVLGSATPSGYLNQNVRSNPTVYESQSIVGATVTLVDTIPIINNTFIKWITASKDYVNNNYKGSTIDTVNDGTNLYYVESGVLKNNVTANIVTFTSNVVAGNVNLWAIGDSALVNIAFERIILGASTTNGYFFNSSSTLNPTDYTGKTNVTTTPTLVDTVPVFGNTFVRWSVVNKDNVNSYYSSSTIDSVNDGGNVYYTEYDVIRSVSTQSVATFTSNITAGNINLWAVGGSSSITTSFQRTILGNSTVSGYPYSNSPYASSWNGGIVGNPIESTSTVAILNSTSSTSYKSGALVVSGGTGIGGNLSVGGNLIISGNTTSANVFSSGYFYSNGAPFATSNYGNVQMLANLAVSNVAVSGISINGVGILSSTEVYDLDDISAYTDGITNTFIPTYNGSAVTITNAWNLDIFVNGVKQPAFKYNSDLVWGGYALTASKGYCIDYSGNVRFADALPATSQVSITTKLGTNTQTTKTYPFKPLDIMLGS
jgi:hypothetical protein